MGSLSISTELTGSEVRHGAAVMPAFSSATHAHAHTLHSALATLAWLGISAQRIAVLRTGREGVAPGRVVGQNPAAGASLSGNTMIQLKIAGLGFVHHLPVGMWDSGGETHAGTREILECFDDPLEKLKHWFHEGAPLFRLAPDDSAACARWLELFGIRPGRWPRSLWYRLATLIAGMSRYSCSQQGCAFVLSVLLDLPVGTFRFRPTQRPMPKTTLSALGGQASRIGVDMILGDSMEDIAGLEIEIGPVTLETYERFNETIEGAALLRQTLELLMPVSCNYQTHWQVLDRGRAPRLGVASSNSRLGINTHLGLELDASLPAISPLPAQPGMYAV